MAMEGAGEMVRDRQRFDEKDDNDAKSRSSVSIYHRHWDIASIDVYYIYYKGVLQIAAQLVERAHSLHIVIKCTKSTPGHNGGSSSSSSNMNTTERVGG